MCALGALTLMVLLARPCYGQSDADLAKQLSNPVASLISVPFQYNYDGRIGPSESGHKNYVNFQPVIPIGLNEEWNVISRTIVPIVGQRNVFEQDSRQSGIGDIVQSLFLSPVKPTAGGLIWGAGPVFLIPTASDDLLGGEKWGLGPTGVVLKQHGPWTYGALANHIWSVGGAGDRSDVSSTFLQPFVSYTTPEAWTFSLNTESTYDWKSRQWSVPVNAFVTKLLKIGSQPVSVGTGVRYWADTFEGGPHGWGARVIVTLLFPK
jgi:hypothetical protein